MLDHDLRALRDEIDSAVPIPRFDTLVTRGRQRRRRSGTGIAIVALLAGGIAIGAGEVAQQDAGPPPTNSPDVPPRTADELIDNKDAEVRWYEQPEPGFQYAVWGVECDDQNCPTALTWSTDNWETRESNLLPASAEAHWLGDSFLIFAQNRLAFLLTADKTRLPIAEPTRARPARIGEVVVGDDRTDAVLLDARTGETYRPLLPEGITVRHLDNSDDGYMRLFGSKADGSAVFATSMDGGVTWERHDVPVTPASAWLNSDGSNIVINQQGLEGLELTLSSDGGETWKQIEDLPFSGASCISTADGLLFVSHGTFLFRSTDESWLEFEEMPDSPLIECPAAVDGILSGPGRDQRFGYVSEDLGDTWTKIDPR